MHWRTGPSVKGRLYKVIIIFFGFVSYPNRLTVHPMHASRVRTHRRLPCRWNYSHHRVLRPLRHLETPEVV
jgi:hypothetical protein